MRKKIEQLLNQHRLMTIATNRPDGWPQATTVGYVNEGLTQGSRMNVGPAAD
jgi:pyridoxamine 5'-phosphate oxidase-like protein